VVLELHTADMVYEVDERDCGGFEDFAAVLARRLPGSKAHAVWWPEVTNPLLRQGEVTVFSRD
jgi:hypothetical protein